MKNAYVPTEVRLMEQCTGLLCFTFGQGCDRDRGRLALNDCTSKSISGRNYKPAYAALSLAKEGPDYLRASS